MSFGALSVSVGVKVVADALGSALIGFLLSLTPLSCDLMGWRGAGGNGASDSGTSFLSHIPNQQCLTPIRVQLHTSSSAASS